MKSTTSKTLERKVLLENNTFYNERGTGAYFGVNMPQNGSKHSNLIKKTSNVKSTTSNTIERKILLENNNSYRERGTVAHFGVKLPQNGS